jgi:hypothetical protein
MNRRGSQTVRSESGGLDLDREQDKVLKKFMRGEISLEQAKRMDQALIEHKITMINNRHSLERQMDAREKA